MTGLPEKIIVIPVGSDGKYLLNIQIMFRGPSCKTKLTIYEELCNERLTIIETNPLIVATDDDGHLALSLNDFKNRKRKLNILVNGTSIKYPLSLEGPPWDYKSNPKEGFLEAMKNLFKSEKDYNK